MKISLLLFLGFLATAYSLHIPGFINGKPMRRYLEDMLYPEIADVDCSFVQELNFTAKVDNFNNDNTDTWNQVKKLHQYLYYECILEI